eukprot:ctg_544.g313
MQHEQTLIMTDAFRCSLRAHDSGSFGAHADWDVDAPTTDGRRQQEGQRPIGREMGTHGSETRSTRTGEGSGEAIQ